MLRFIQLGENDAFPTYNLLVGVAIAVAMLYLHYDSSYKSLKENEKNRVQAALLMALLFGFLGAYLLDAYTQNISLKWENLNEIGLTFYGGFISGLVVFSLLILQSSVSLLKTLNNFTPAFCLAHSIGRIGCFFAGCCFGAPTLLPTGVAFPENSLAQIHFQENIVVHPTQLYESFFIFTIFLVVKQVHVRSKFLLYMLSYAVFRFFVEFIRADNRGSVFEYTVLSPSQIIALFVFVIATGVIIYKNTNFIKPKKVIF